MDSQQRNLIFAVIFSVAILFAFQVFFAPPPSSVTQDSSSDVLQEEGRGSPLPSASTRQDLTVLPDRKSQHVRSGVGQPLRSFEQQAMSGSMSLVGARFSSLFLNHYRQTLDAESKRIVLLSPGGDAPAYFAQFGWSAPKGVRVPGALSLWHVEGGDFTPERPLTLSWDNGSGLRFLQEIWIAGDYLFVIRQRVENRLPQGVLLAPYGLISRHNPPDPLGFYILHEGPLGVFDEKLHESDYEDVRDSGRIPYRSRGGWLGITDKYWLTALIPAQDQDIEGRFVYRRTPTGDDVYQVDFRYPSVEVESGGSHTTTSRFFAGAKELVLLDLYEKEYGIARLDLAIDFGWFYLITKPLSYALHYLNLGLSNLGLAILLLTVLIRILLFPLANKSFRSMARMRHFQPQIQALRERYKNDRQELQKAMMGLYKKEGINPMSGCLPVVLQIPIFFALYKVMFVSIEMRHAPFFGWIHDLSAPDPTSFLNGFGLFPWAVPSLGFFSFLNIGIWPVLMGLTMYLQQRLNPSPPDPVQAKVFSLLPFLFTFLLASFPAGLVIYWTWSNLLGIVQQAFIMKRAGVSLGWFDKWTWSNLLGIVQQAIMKRAGVSLGWFDKKRKKGDQAD